MDQLRSNAVKNMMLRREGRQNSEEQFLNWLPQTPSSSTTNSSSRVDWLEKNRQKCQPCAQGGPCCNRSFNYPCSSDCTCKLVETWAKLTLTDDQRRSEALRVKHEKKCPPAPKISDDVKYVNAWREPTMSTFKNHWHSTKRNTLKVPAKDMDNVNCTWQGWDHYDEFKTTSSNYGSVNQNPKTATKAYGLRRLSL